MIPAIHIMNLRTLDLNLLLVFEALMDERNVTRSFALRAILSPGLL